MQKGAIELMEKLLLHFTDTKRGIIGCKNTPTMLRFIDFAMLVMSSSGLTHLDYGSVATSDHIIFGKRIRELGFEFVNCESSIGDTELSEKKTDRERWLPVHLRTPKEHFNTTKRDQ
jgi:hypothetical protein